MQCCLSSSHHHHHNIFKQLIFLLASFTEFVQVTAKFVSVFWSHTHPLYHLLKMIFITDMTQCQLKFMIVLKKEAHIFSLIYQGSDSFISFANRRNSYDFSFRVVCCLLWAEINLKLDPCRLRVGRNGVASLKLGSSSHNLTKII